MSSIEFLTPDGFPLRRASDLCRTCASRCRAGARSRAASTAAQPDAIHVATEGPIGLAARAYCRRRGLPFTTSYTTRFPEYIAARFPIPESLELRGAAALPWRRRRHDGLDAVADGRAARARLPEPRACGRAASTPICSRRSGRCRSICRGRSSSPRDGLRSRRTSKLSCRSICPAPRSWSATGRRRPS